MARKRDHSGETLHEVTFLSKSNVKTSQDSYFYWGRCSCGTERLFNYAAFACNKQYSCGCFQKRKAAEVMRKICSGEIKCNRKPPVKKIKIEKVRPEPKKTFKRIKPIYKVG